MNVSKLGLKAIFLFCFFLLLGRLFFFPFGDEPDFEVRAYELVKEIQPWWTPFYFFQPILRDFQFYTNCITDSSLFSYWSNIDGVSCTEDIQQSLARYLLIIISLTPIFLMIIFRNLSLRFVNTLGLRFSKEEWFHRLDILSIVFLFSGFIYYIGVLAVEQFVLVLALLIFLFWGRWVIVAICIILIFLLDIGNATVISTFVLITYSFSKLQKRTIVLTSIIVALAALVLGISSVSIIGNIAFLAEKSTAIVEREQNLGLRDKYPIYLRPFITYITGIFFTPSGVKVIPVYLIYGIYIIKFFIEKKSSAIGGKISYNSFVLLFGGLTTVFLFVFILPNYSNAKYYMFILPFMLYSVSDPKSKKRTVNLIIAMNCLLYFHLLLFRL